MRKDELEFRYYEIPSDIPLIALLGEKWIRQYGNDAMHFHNCMEIGYCYYGQGDMYFGQRKVAYGPGSITVIPRNFPHHTFQTDVPPNRWEYLFIDIERFSRNMFSYKKGHANTLAKQLNSKMFLVSGKDEPEIETLLLLILNEMRKKEKFYRKCVEGLVQALLLKIVRYAGNEGELEEPFSYSADYGIILDVLNYIENHYMEEIRIEALAERFHMSIANFRRKFHSCMNIAPAEYINLIRIENACELLRMTEYRVEDIAVRTGFHSTETFIRNFKKLTGYSPLQWRKMEKQKENNLQNYNVSILKGW
ncbi:MAG: helix-turn-helix transcriptional regulator [Lachnospiraceae bacterium]|nr:helix-turn-helix transcriptional regulator [Lachnospiraceae bacterium]